MAKSISKVLAGLQDEWKEAEAAEGRKKLEGDFVASIKSMEVELSKNSGRPQVKTVFEIVEPEKYEGETVFRFDGLTEQGMPYLKAFADTIGMELPSKLKDLPDTIAEFETDSLFDITVATKNDFTNVYVNGVSGEEGEDDSDDDDDDSSSDDDDDDDNNSDDDSDDDSNDDTDDDDDNDDDDDVKSKKKGKIKTKTKTKIKNKDKKKKGTKKKKKK